MPSALACDETRIRVEAGGWLQAAMACRTQVHKSWVHQVIFLSFVTSCLTLPREEPKLHECPAAGMAVQQPLRHACACPTRAELRKQHSPGFAGQEDRRELAGLGLAWA